MEHRRVREGYFGCPNCRSSYPVTGGFADFRGSGRPVDPMFPPNAALPNPVHVAPLPSDDAEAGLRLAAMLGVREGPCLLLLMGAPVGQASRLAAMIPEVEIVAFHAETRHWPEASGVSRGIAGAALPFFSGALRGVALDTCSVRPDALGEPLRVLAPGARLVLELGDGQDRVGWQDALEQARLDILLATDRLLVGQK